MTRKAIATYARTGFTLPEMLIAMVTFVIVMGLAFNTLFASNAVRQAASARLDIFQNGRVTLDVITREMRNASLRKADVTYTQREKTAVLGGSFDVLTRQDNARGRFIVNDWPPYEPNVDGRDRRVYLGNDFDDDGDGKVDEEAFDGLDNDGDAGETSDGPVDIEDRAMADGLDNNGNGLVDEGIDEDIYYPRDMVNFTTLLDSGQGSDLIEVGYAIDTRTGRDLLRRTAYSSDDSQEQVDGIYPSSIQYALGQNPVHPRTGVAAPSFDPENQTEGNLQNPNDIEQNVELVSLNILGFDCKAYYHDWAIAEENGNRNLKITDLPISPVYGPYSFPLRSWDSSVENQALLPYRFNADQFPILPNGKDDLAIIPGTEDYLSFEGKPDSAKLRGRIESVMKRTDGLPRLVEITLFVQDKNRVKEDAVKLSTRVFLPFVSGDE